MTVILLTLTLPGCRFLHPPERKVPTVRTALRVYFHRAGAPDAPPVVRVRTVTSGATLSPEERVRRAIGALLAGPTKAERKNGYLSAIPARVRLRGVEVDRPLAVLDFNAELERTGGTTGVAALLDEIAYTAASVPGVKGVVLRIEGQRVGTDDRPFTGEGFLFLHLHPPVDGKWAAVLGPADALDLFIAVIPERDQMWRMLGPRAREAFGSPAGIEAEAYAEGLGAWRNYRVEKVAIEDGRATVIIAGRQVLEGQVEPDARYGARMVREGGRWRFDLGSRND